MARVRSGAPAVTARPPPRRPRLPPLGAAAAAWLWLAPTAAWSQDRSPQLVRPLPPEYPDDAPPGATGTVDVELTVGADGTLLEARVVDGPEVFHAAALHTARRLEVRPALEDGVPVAGTLLLHFHFEDPHEPDHDHGPAEEIIVRAERADAHDAHARATLDDRELEATAARTLAESVAEVPGVQLSRTSGSAAKPIVRGHNERRLLVLYDGVRHESQKWGPDHAPEIDPFTAGSITVVKGPAGARYGPDAIGGVLLVQPPPMRSETGLGGKAMALGGTNGRRGYGALRLDAVPHAAQAWSLRLEGSFNDAAAQQAPDYVLGNTAAREWSAGGAAEWGQADWTLRLRVHHFDRQEGVFYGVRTATPEEFEAQYAAGVPANAALWSVDRTIDRPSQSVTHDLATLHAEKATDGGWTWRAIYAFQRNHRLESEQVRSAATAGAQYDFTLRTHSLDAHAEGPRVVLGRWKLDPGLGAQGGFQENVYRGYALIPNHRSFSGSAFGHGRLLGDHGAITAAARYDHLDRTAYLRTEDFERHVARDTLRPDDCPAYDHGKACARRYDTGSVSIGGMWHAVPHTLDLKLDLSRGSRFPAVDELYLIGSAPSLPVYAIGDPGLDVETTWGLSPTAVFTHPLLDAEVGGFANRVDDYIYFAPALGPDGTPTYTVTIDGSWPEYTVQPITAHFVGGDGYLDVAPQEVVGLRTQGALVRATDAATGAALVGIPPDQVSSTLYLRPPPPGAVQRWWLGVEVERLARQRHADASVDVLPAPAGATLLHAELQAELRWADHDWRLALQGSNLLDTAYREYTSLLRYYADQPGRDLRLRVSVDL